MSHAHKVDPQTAQARSAPPPLPRPTHSHIAPRADDSSVRLTAAGERAPRAELPRAPRLSIPAHSDAAIVPLWDDSSLPLRSAQKRVKSRAFWISTTTISLAVGALVAASLMTLRSGDYEQILPHLQNQQGAAARSAPVQPLAAGSQPAAQSAAGDLMVIELAELDQPMVVELAELDELAAAEAAAQPIVIPELVVTSSVASKKVTKVARRAPKSRGKRGRTQFQVTWPVQPQAEAPVEAVVEAPPAPEAQPEAAGGDAVAAEARAVLDSPAPLAPALPEKLTRDQVHRGLDSVRAKVLACAHGTYGKILANVTISAPGRVSNAAIEGTFTGTNAASCMAEKVAGATFPAFSGPDISVRFPYSF